MRFLQERVNSPFSDLLLSFLKVVEMFMAREETDWTTLMMAAWSEDPNMFEVVLEALDRRLAKEQVTHTRMRWYIVCISVFLPSVLGACG